MWGTTWYAVRASTGPEGFPTLESAAMRFTIATIILAPIVVGLRLGPWPRDGADLGVDGGGRRARRGQLRAGLLRRGAHPGRLAAVLFSTQPLMLAGLLTATGFERVRRSDILGAAVALAGVAVIFADRWRVSTSQVVGLVMILGAVAASASYSFVLKRRAGALTRSWSR